MIEEQNINQLPKDWKWVKLVEVCEKIVDGSHNPPKPKNSGLPMLSAKDIYNNKIYFDEPRLIDEDDFAVENRRTNINPGDILLTIVATIGRTAVVPIKSPRFTLQRSVAVLKTSHNAYFFCYAFQTPKFQQQLRYYAKGTAQKGVYLKTLSQLEIPLPPKLTQQAIVSKIEELFSELDKGIEQLKTAQQQLKTYRQSVLKAAFEGRLTSLNYDFYDLHDEHDLTIAAEREVDYKTKNNQGNQNNHINQSSDKGELPEGWKIANLGDVIEKPKYGTSKKCEYETKGIGVLRIPNIVKGIVDSEDLKFAEFDANEIESYSLREGDILTIRSNGSVDIVGKCALITKKDEGFLYAGYLIRLRPLEKLISPKYLINILSSISLRNQIERKAKSTSGVNNINSEELSGLQISLPPIEEQNNIVQEIESRISVADKMEESIIQSLQQAEALRQSILKKAFEGKLTN